MPDIVLSDVSVVYRNAGTSVAVRALSGVSVTFPACRIHAVVGASGGGKTTLLKVIAGLLAYDGTVRFDGRDAENLSPKDRHLAMVSQQYTLYPHMTVFENIAFPLKGMRASVPEIRSRVNEIAEDLGLTPCLTRRPKQLSGGQQQRVALARALVRRPEICLFDEPFSNVDPAQRTAFRTLVRDTLHKWNVTAVYVTHDIGEALALGDTVTVIDDGVAVFSGTPEEFCCTDVQAAVDLRQEGTIIW